VKILVLGASGGVGQEVVAEALARGHAVTAASRSGTDVPGATTVSLDATDAAAVADAVAGHDAVVNAIGPRAGQDDDGHLARAAEAIIAGLHRAGVLRLVVIGGTGTLEVAPGMRLVSTLDFPADFKPVAEAHSAALDVLLTAADLEWTYLAPPPEFAPGPRTVAYRTGGTGMLLDAEGRGRLSYGDIAVAAIDVIEQHSFVRERVAVAY